MSAKWFINRARYEGKISADFLDPRVLQTLTFI